MAVKFRRLGGFAALIAIAIPAQLAAQEEHQDKRKHTTHYSVTDLGTLGGPDSGFLLGTQVLNDRGTTVGGADTASPDLNYPNVNPLLGFPGNGTRPFVQHGFKWHEGALTDLGALPGDNNNSYANWVNANGRTVGESEDGSIDPLTGFPEVVAVAWEHGRIINLGTLGGYESEALAVNDKGQVVGFATKCNTGSPPVSFCFHQCDPGNPNPRGSLGHRCHQGFGHPRRPGCRGFLLEQPRTGTRILIYELDGNQSGHRPANHTCIPLGGRQND